MHVDIVTSGTGEETDGRFALERTNANDDIEWEGQREGYWLHTTATRRQRPPMLAVRASYDDALNYRTI